MMDGTLVTLVYFSNFSNYKTFVTKGLYSILLHNTLLLKLLKSIKVANGTNPPRIPEKTREMKIPALTTKVLLKSIKGGPPSW